jgi:Ca2+/H+ antiporter, TMEM165/GDT1 family
MRRRIKEKIPVIIFFGLVFLAVFGYIVMLLWNAILPDVLNAKPITFWQSLGLLALAKILFGGFGGWRHKQRWREGMHMKWQNMTPEEREKFKEEWKNRCNWRNRWGKEQSTPQEKEPGSEPTQS